MIVSKVPDQFSDITTEFYKWPIQLRTSLQLLPFEVVI